MIVRKCAISLITTLVLLSVASCAKNPVTGKNELILMSEQSELQLGKANYLPLRQSQGGDYVVDPAVERYVQQVGKKLSAVSDRKLPYEFNVINNSVPNAWALPGGKISINRGLLVELKNEAELAAVLGHEIVHAAAKHGARGQTRGLLLQTAVIGATIAGSRKGYGQLAQVGSSIGAQIVNSKYGRGAELESDLYGMEYMSRAGYNPRGAVDLQRTFVKLSEGRRQDFISGLFASHPPSQERVDTNIKTAGKLPQGGEVGRQRFERAMARLRKSASAYENFDKAQAAFKKGNKKAAQTLVKQAIRIEPKEGHFHSLLGDIALDSNDLRRAKGYFDKAISLNNQMFYYYLKRASIYEASNNQSAAQADYARSLKLMPTADAQAALGRIAQVNGRDEEAKQWYAMAAQADGPVGKAAVAGLLSLDLSDNPQNYLLLRQGLTQKGTFAVKITNKTSQPLVNVQLSFQSISKRTAKKRRVRGVIKPGQSQLIDTGQRMSNQQLRDTRVVVVNAEIAR